MKVASFALMDLNTGSGRYALGLANSLSKSVEVKLFTSKRNQKYIGKVNNDLKVDYTKFFRPMGSLGKKWLGFRNPINFLSLILLIKKIREYNPDIIHIQNGYEWLFFGYPFLYKYPIVTSLHDPIPHTGENTWLQRFVVDSTSKNSDGIIVHGQKLENLFSDKFKYPLSRIFVAQLIYEISDDIKASNTPQKNTILFQGRIVRYKGLENLVTAVDLVTKKINNLKVIIAGSGNLKPYFKKSPDPKVYEIINEWVSKKKLNSIFSKAEVVVLPYNDATQSAIIPLAYAFGKPVITTDVGALSEVVIHGKTGLLIPRKNSLRLAASIIKLLEDNEIRKHMSINSRKYLEEELSWENKIHIDNMLSIYNSVINIKIEGFT